MKKTTFLSFAKLNLSLLIFPSPAPGALHPLQAVFQTISCYDRITFSHEPNGSKGFTLTCSSPGLPVDSTNLLDKVYRRFEHKIPGLMTVHLEKHIPMGGGLGGGSSNAAAFLTYLKQEQWIETKDLKCAIALGSDIPFFLTGGTAQVSGIGEQVSQLPQGPQTNFVLINPGCEIATPHAYRWLDETPQAFANIDDKSTTLFSPPYLGFNSFRSIVFSRFPVFEKIESILSANDSPRLYLSGTGATIFMAFKTLSEAQNWYQKARNLFPEYWVYLAQNTTSGSCLENSNAEI